MKREGNEIRAWLVRKGISVSDVARAAGIKRPVVSDTIHGRRNNRKALQALVEAGCPAKLLALPEDMKDQQAA